MSEHLREAPSPRRRPLDQPDELQKATAAVNNAAAAVGQLVRTAEYGVRVSRAFHMIEDARLNLQEEQRYASGVERPNPGAQVVRPEVTHRGPISAPERGVQGG